MTIKRLTFWTLITAFLATAFLTAFPAFATDTAGEVIGVAKNWQYGFQPPASPMKEKMEHFHNDLLVPLITVISIFVMCLLLYVMLRFNKRANPVPSKTTHNTMLEVVWTLVPVIILVILVVPSMRLLYYVDRTNEAEMTLNITGNQWYWGYEYPDNGGISFLSNLIPDDKIDPAKGQVRLLSTDNPVVLPVETNIRLIMTATDVLHAWAVPSFGVKLDAVPGRHNETWVRIDKEGTFFGQCSELCGDGHGFMPIEVHAVSKDKFAAWVKEQGGTMPEKTAANDNNPDKAGAEAAGKE